MLSRFYSSEITHFFNCFADALHFTVHTAVHTALHAALYSALNSALHSALHFALYSGLLFTLLYTLNSILWCTSLLTTRRYDIIIIEFRSEHSIPNNYYYRSIYMILNLLTNSLTKVINVKYISYFRMIKCYIFILHFAIPKLLL